jgi:3-hydroxyisobutyrate dehydrogenase
MAAKGKKVAFIGLGVMGYPMAGHLVNKGGCDVTVYNRTAAKAAEWTRQHKGARAATPAEAARGCDIVFICVGNDDDLRAVVYGETGVLAGMKKGAILVDHTTASADVAREVDAAARKQGRHFLDGPVSGGQAGAVNGVLTVMMGGEQKAFDAAKPVIDSYARAVTLLGPAGSGQLTKMVNQICIAGLVQALSEGLNFASRAGLDAKRVVEVISKGAAQSWQMENRGNTMVDDKFDFGFAVNWMRKDLGICLDEAKRNGARLPVTALVDQFYAGVQALGGGRWDTSSLIRLLSAAPAGAAQPAKAAAKAKAKAKPKAAR